MDHDESEDTSIERISDVDSADELMTADELVEELLIEEISIDGMCGVY